MSPRRAAVLVPFTLFALASAFGSNASVVAGCSTCAGTGEVCTNEVDSNGKFDTTLAPTCCHGSCIICAPLGDDTSGICLDAPYCCPAGNPCHDDATCCSGVCANQFPSLVGGMIGTCR